MRDRLGLIRMNDRATISEAANAWINGDYARFDDILNANPDIPEEAVITAINKLRPDLSIRYEGSKA